MMADKRLSKRSSRAAVDAFLHKMESMRGLRPGKPRGRLIFALDATASREPTWDRACHIQSQMFSAAAQVGGLTIQLCYYRGFGEFYASPWLERSEDLLRQMTAVGCRAGQTQLGKLLQHALRENRSNKIDALVFVGDCMEEDPAQLAAMAGRLGLLKLPCFVFQEGDDPLARSTFQQVARLSGGAYCRFDAQSARQLCDLLTAVAVYAAGGVQALERLADDQGGVVLQISSHLKGKGK